MSGAPPDIAMVLAAGLGKRMRPLTETVPKPLIAIAGRTLLDRSLDTLAAAGVDRAVVNIHWLGAQIAAHVVERTDIAVTISDESERLLDSAGGIVKALPLLGAGPFYILNADTFWIETGEPALKSMARLWDAAAMDMLLLLADPGRATGHDGAGDFLRAEDGRLSRARGAKGGYIYAGAAIADSALFAGAAAEPHSLNAYFDRAIAAGRLFGQVLDGHWITVGSPAAIAPAEAVLSGLDAQRGGDR